MKLEKLKYISHKYDDGGSFKELYPIVKAESWLKSNQNWYYQKQGQLVQKDWVYDKGEWYYVSSSGAMIENDWVKDNGKWYYLASSGKMLRNTYTPDGYYVGNSGAWQ